jgi:hypothetical protein
MNRIVYIIFTGALCAGLLQGCTCKRSDNKKGITIVVNKENFKIKVDRFENDLFSVKSDSMEAGISKLKAKYGEFFELYNYKMVKIGTSNDKGYPKELHRFITDYYMKLDYERVKKVYPNVDALTGDLSAAFTNFKEYFPKKRIPRVVTCISGWNQSVVTSDSVLAIALDKYLGRECDFYLRLQLDNYMRYTMQREYIVPDCMRAWGYATFAFNDSVSAYNVLNNMLYEGKMLYFMKKMLPETPDSIIFGFSPSQLKWCNKNAKSMWTYLLEYKLLFSTDYMIIRKLVFPAPFTSYFPKESPGRAVVWLGYKIIEAYMDENQTVTLSQLMEATDYQQILRKSKFKP